MRRSGVLTEIVLPVHGGGTQCVLHTYGFGTAVGPGPSHHFAFCARFIISCRHPAGEETDYANTQATCARTCLPPPTVLYRSHACFSIFLNFILASTSDAEITIAFTQ